MPWKESSVMDERLRFLARVLDGEPMTEVCRDAKTSATAITGLGLRLCLTTSSHYRSIHAFGAHAWESCSDRGSREQG
jgi:hypothetical protein